MVPGGPSYPQAESSLSGTKQVSGQQHWSIIPWEECHLLHTHETSFSDPCVPALAGVFRPWLVCSSPGWCVLVSAAVHSAACTPLTTLCYLSTTTLMSASQEPSATSTNKEISTERWKGSP